MEWLFTYSMSSFEIVFNPRLENNMFKEEYLNQEKENMRQRIVGKVDQ